MLGNTLNPNSTMAKEMNYALDNESKAHAAFDIKNQKEYTGVPLPKRKRVSSQNLLGAIYIETHFPIFYSTDRDRARPRRPGPGTSSGVAANPSRRLWTSCWSGNGSRAANS